MRTKAIAECITEKISGEWGTAPTNSTGIRVIRTANFVNDGTINFDKIVFRNIRKTKVDKKKLFSGDVIIEKSGGSPTQLVGRVVYFENPDNQIYLCNNFTTILRPDPKKTFPKYLFYALFFNHKKGKTLRYQNKTTGIINLKLDNYLKSKIPFPPLDSQIRIATLLSRVEVLIATRKDNLRLLDEFLKSTFLEMFGNPMKNEKRWDKPELKNNFGEISTGNTPPRSNAANYSPAFIEWIKTGNIDQDQTYLTPASEFLSETGLKKARTVHEGALLVACIAGSIESIGRAAIANRKFAFNQQINAIQPHTDINPLFLYWLFRISKVYIQSFAPKGMKKIITKGNFEKITMIKPPKDLQDQFAAIVEKVESLKTLYQQSLSDLENLYGALSQKAFKGELDLSRIPMENLPKAPPPKGRIGLFNEDPS